MTNFGLLEASGVDFGSILTPSGSPQKDPPKNVFWMDFWIDFKAQNTKSLEGSAVCAGPVEALFKQY